VLLPYLVSEEERAILTRFLGKLDVKVGVLEGEYTAIGNLVCANDFGAIVSPNITQADVVEETLGVKVLQEGLGGHTDVGAVVSATNNGFIAHPALEKELDKIEKALKVKGLRSTVNFGSPYVKAGIIANSNGYITGFKTSGIELGRIDDALGFV
jgi:translation initiation factor 6